MKEQTTPKPIITVRGISKQYFISTANKRLKKRSLAESLLTPYHKLVDISSSLRGGNGNTFWALKDIDFDVYRGERVGIIGRNGAGKTTLLKILSRLIYPTEGEVTIRGTVTPLFGVGTGFQANLTGRENIFLDASLYGLTKSQIRAKFDDIVEFSGVRKFIDTPIKYYSKGMNARLAFSVAAHLDPDILILDEILSVGDMLFREKCLKAIDGMTGRGRTLLFVSHGMGNVLQFCDKVIWLEEGRIRFMGNVVEGVELYQTAMSPSKNEVSVEHRTERAGTGHLVVTRIGLFDEHMRPVEAAVTGRDLVVVLHYKCDLARLHESQTQIACCLYIENERTQRLCGMPNTILKSHKPVNAAREGKIVCTIKRLPLLPDHYYMSYMLGVGNETADKLFQSRGLVVLDGDFYGSGKLPHQNMGPVCVDYEWEHQAL